MKITKVRTLCITFVVVALLLFVFGGSLVRYSPSETSLDLISFAGGSASSSSAEASGVKKLPIHEEVERPGMSTVQLQSNLTGGRDSTNINSKSNDTAVDPIGVPGGEETSIIDQTIKDGKRKRSNNSSGKNDEASALEKGLARARVAIRSAAAAGISEEWKKSVNDSYFPTDDAALRIYRNPVAFYRSYKEMERRFKVYVYTEGDPPLVHTSPCKDIYTTEGRFMLEMELGSGGMRFRTRNPMKSHVFFMPFSVTFMVSYIYEPRFRLTPITNFVFDYVTTISRKYPFWNTTHGADHFMIACHDWGPHASRGHKELYKNSIRVLCNANSSEGFNPQKDVTLPEINLKTGNIHPKLLTFLNTTTTHNKTNRSNLAFFAGGVNGPIRPILLSHWKDKGDKDMKVYEYLPQGKAAQGEYYTYMLNSKFCLCPSGYEVASPRIVEAIYADCVPVILSENYILPFSDVLNWDAFSVTVDVKDMAKLKDILVRIDEDKYGKLLEGVRVVRKHFLINNPVKRFDFYHMILHSIWLRRLNLRLPNM